jgi:cell division control protein 12
MPLSVIGAEKDVTTSDGRTVRGRQYPWGVAEVENDSHCDFRKLRNLLVRKFMLDLLFATGDHYERYRTAHLVAQGRTDGDGDYAAKELVNKMKEDEEVLRRRLTEQVKNEEGRFKQWEQKVLPNSEANTCSC